MKRTATIATVWLLPPLLFTAEVAAHHGIDLPVYLHVIFGIAAFTGRRDFRVAR
jgi:hypothetical protein